MYSRLLNKFLISRLIKILPVHRDRPVYVPNIYAEEQLVYIIELFIKGNDVRGIEFNDRLPWQASGQVSFENTRTHIFICPNNYVYCGDPLKHSQKTATS